MARAAQTLVDEVERALEPLDRARRVLYRALVPWLGPWVGHRSLRIAAMGILAALTSFLLAVTLPLPLLALAPLLLGVPHLVADLRYLVARPGVTRAVGPWLRTIGLLLALCALTSELSLGLLGALLAVLGAPTSRRRRLLLAVPLAIGIAALLLWPVEGGALFAHLHNVAAVGLWLLLSDSTRAGLPGRLALAALFLGPGALIASGWLDPWLTAASLAPPGMPGLHTHARILAPLDDPALALRGVALFAYGQSLHYSLWLRLIPEELRERQAPPSLRAAWRELSREVGAPLLGLAVLLSVGLGVWALFDLATAREGYLRLAFFHGPLEIVVASRVIALGASVVQPCRG